MGRNRLVAVMAAFGIASPLALVSVTGASAQTVAPAAGSTCTSSWQPTPELGSVGTNEAQLSAVSSASPSDIWAVGDTIQHGGTPTQPTTTYGPLINHWNGSAWTLAPPPISGINTVLSGVADDGPSDAWAVGNQGYDGTAGSSTALIEHWDGTLWSVVTTAPAPADSDLGGVIAFGTADAWAFGGVGSSALIEHWDGSAWTTVAAPAGASGVGRVSADSANDIWALGSSFVLHYDGSTWTSMPLATPNSGVYNGIDVISPTNVWAVGDQNDPTAQFERTMPLASHWDGTAWSVVDTSALPSNNAVLNGVTAVPGGILAVGYYEEPLKLERLFEFYNGSTWTQESPGLNGHADAVITASDGTVWTVGRVTLGEGLFASVPPDPGTVPLASHGSGTSWTDTQVAEPTQPAMLVGLASTGTSALVGGWMDTGGYSGISDQWTGSSWNAPKYLATSFTTTPDGTVTAVATDNAGDYFETVQAGSGATNPGVLSNGSTTPVAQGPAGSNLYGISLDSATDGWAVGDTGGTTPTPLFIQHTGSGWTTFAGTLPLASGTLNAVAAFSPTAAWAVGSSAAGSGVPLIEQWDGTLWTPVPSLPGLSGASGAFTAVSADAANDVWAVGEVLAAGGTSYTPVIEHFDGTAWTQATPAAAGDNGGFSGVLARSPTDVYAVGQYADSAGNLPLIEHWDGTQWTQMDTSALPAQGILDSIAVVGDGLWAVGAQFDSDGVPSPLVASLCYTPAAGIPEAPATPALAIAGVAAALFTQWRRRRAT